MITSKTNAAIIGIILGICLLLSSLSFFMYTQGKVIVNAESNEYSGVENAFVRGKNFYAHGQIKSITYKGATQDDDCYAETVPTEINCC